MTSSQQATQQQATGPRGAREAALLVAIFLTVGAGTLATYWIGSRGGQTKTVEVATAAAQAPVIPRAVASAPTDLEVVHADVYFDFKSTRLRADAVRLLQEKAALMDRASTWVVLVEGHADRQGPPEYNKALAQRRAEAVKQFLVELGVAEATIRVVAVGPEGALCDEPGTACQQLNRRVHLEIRKLSRPAPAPARAAITDGDELTTGAPGPARP